MAMSKQAPLVSVIMSAYNHERFVRQAVDSVLTQSMGNFEFLIADDGSTDGTSDILRTFTDSRIRLFLYETNEGACVRLNQLLDECTGEFIALINSDDEFEQDKLALQVAYMRGNPQLSASFTWVYLIDEQSKRISHYHYQIFDQENRTRTQWLKRLFFEGNCFCHPTILARRKRYKQRFDPRLCKLPDMEFWIRLLMKEEVGIFQQRLTRFRVLANEQNMSGHRPETLNLIAHETPILMEHYTGLSESDCAAVFGYTGDAVTRAYAAYTAALRGSPPMQTWGMQGLYQLMAIEPRKLKQLGFDYNALFSLGKNLDVFSQCSIISELYYATHQQVEDAPHYLNSFCDGQKLAQSACQSDTFSFDFVVNKHVFALRFDPCSLPCEIQLKTAVAYTDTGRLNLVPLGFGNGTPCGNMMRFEHFDPSIIYILGRTDEVKQVRFSGKWRFLQPAALLPTPIGINWMQQYENSKCRYI